MASVERIQRLLQVVALLQSGRSLNSKEIADASGVSRRTVFRDLAVLQESGIQIRYDVERQTYSLPAQTFLPPTDFTLDETLSLLVLCHGMGKTNGLPFHRAARSAAVKLLSSLPGHLREFLGEMTELVSIQLDPRNPLTESEQHYDNIMRGLSKHRQVRIRYKSLTEWKEISTCLSPYRVVFHRRSWYAIGRSSLHREVRTFNIGRILRSEVLDSAYRIPPRFSLERYLGNAWSLIPEKGKPHTVVIRFRKQVAYNVAEVQWHKTQRIIWNDDESLDFHVTVDGLGEILWWVLGYGDQAEVLQPPQLRKMIAEHVENMRETYES